MKIIKNFSFITLLLITLLFVNFSTVSATTEACNLKLKLSSNSTSINVGDEISITVNISSVSGFDGIHLIAAKKVYDSNTFKYLGCYPQNGWELKGDSTNIVLHRSAGDSKAGSICILKFKALTNVNSSTISLKNLDATGNNGDVYYEDGNVNSPSINIKISENLSVQAKSEVAATKNKVTTSRSTTPTTSREEVIEKKDTNIINNIDTQSNVSISNNDLITEKNSNSQNLNNNSTQEDNNIINENTIIEKTVEVENSNVDINNIEENVNTKVAVAKNENSNVTKIVITTLLGGSVIAVISYCFVFIKK